MRDEDGFTFLFREHYQAVLRYAWRRIGPGDAGDIAAETFKIAWEKYHRIPADRQLPWLYTTARQLIMNLVRKDERRGELLVEELEPGIGGDPAASVAARQAALAALNELSADDRELVLLVSWEGLDARQAAAVIGYPESAAAMRLHRARKRLRCLLGEEKRSTYEESAL
ncbi:RNA polymerase sigma factor [Nonomuraea muscovyensis]